jgi:hypothetical protein
MHNPTHLIALLQYLENLMHVIRPRHLARMQPSPPNRKNCHRPPRPQNPRSSRPEGLHVEPMRRCSSRNQVYRSIRHTITYLRLTLPKGNRTFLSTSADSVGSSDHLCAGIDSEGVVEVDREVAGSGARSTPQVQKSVAGTASGFVQVDDFLYESFRVAASSLGVFECLC